MKFEEKLVQLRKARGFTQEQLAEQLGVSRQAVSRWESGESTPDLLNLTGLCSCFGVSADYLINDDISDTEEIPVVRKKTQELNAVKQKSRYGHLFSAVCFIIATLCNIIVAATSDTGSKTALYCVLAAATGFMAVTQLTLYLKK